jgi:hypothetical protein
MNLKLGFFLFEPSLGLNGGTLRKENAFKFLKSTIYGRQPELCNFAIMFGPDATYDSLNVDITVEIPPISEVKFKHNKFLSNKRKFKNGVIPLPTKRKLSVYNEVLDDTTLVMTPTPPNTKPLPNLTTEESSSSNIVNPPPEILTSPSIVNPPTTEEISTSSSSINASDLDTVNSSEDIVKQQPSKGKTRKKKIKNNPI